MAHKKFQGTVVNNKMDKTIVVKVNRTRMHHLYKKRYTVSKKYKVHDPKEEANIDDKVVFEECRPLSKDKRWRLTEVQSSKIKNQSDALKSKIDK